MTGCDLLVTGGSGQLGRAVLAAAAARGLSAQGVSSQQMPLADRGAIFAGVAAAAPRAIVHCAAATNVDGCEGDALGAYRTNALGTAWVAEAAAARGCELVYVSTDFVFDGAADVAYAVDAPTRPLSVYGASKRLGEEAVLAHGRDGFRVVRTSWVFGPGGRNFPKAILDRARAGQPLKVVTDQVGRPTLSVDLAEALLDLLALRAPGGVYHCANEGVCSWHGFAMAVLAAAGHGDVPVGEQRAADLQRPAPRPAFSVLDTGKLDALRGRKMPHHADAIARWLRLDALAAAGSAGRASDPLGGKRY